MKGKIVKIKSYTRLNVGINQSRGISSFSTSQFYSLEDMEHDLAQKNFTKIDKTDFSSDANSPFALKTGEIIISLGARRCALVSKSNSGKILKNTFVRVEITDNNIDPWYFCYSINESDIFRQSVSTELISAVRPLSATILGEGRIFLPEINEQRSIGAIYKDICRIKYLCDEKYNKTQMILNRITVAE